MSASQPFPRLRHPLRPRHTTHTTDRTETTGHTTALSVSLLGTRLALGAVFLWAFLDKTFGLGYATPSTRAWVNGGSPTRGFLSGVAAGPLESVFHSWAGAAWADWLFMTALLGVGAAVLLGVATRPAAAAGTVLMGLMWLAEWPPARHLSDGSPSMSTNPLVDYHVLYALLLVLLAASAHHDRWTAGPLWQRLPVVRDHRWLH